MKFSGIYRIRNLVTGDTYVGQSVNITKRWWEHRNKLAANRHANPILQNAYDKYGVDSFEFKILEICPRDMLDQREQEQLDSGQHRYNIAKFAGSSTRGLKLSEKTRARMSAAKRGRRDPHIHTGRGYTSFVNKKSGITYWKAQWRPAPGQKTKTKNFKTEEAAAAFIAELRAQLVNT